MRLPPVIAHHLIWTAYGTWLPNDPRGSGSRIVISPKIATLGELHFGRKKAQPASKALREFYAQAEQRLTHPVVRFTEPRFTVIASALEHAIRERSYTCYACVVMPDHVHLIIRRHRDRAETMIDELQASTRLRFSASGIFPPNHPVWTLGGWKRFLSDPGKVHDVIRYVDDNPLKIGLPPQHWPFVTLYDNWPRHKR